MIKSDLRETSGNDHFASCTFPFRLRHSPSGWACFMRRAPARSGLPAFTFAFAQFHASLFRRSRSDAAARARNVRLGRIKRLPTDPIEWFANRNVWATLPKAVSQPQFPSCERLCSYFTIEIWPMQREERKNIDSSNGLLFHWFYHWAASSAARFARPQGERTIKLIWFQENSSNPRNSPRFVVAVDSIVSRAADTHYGEHSKRCPHRN